MIVLSLPWLVSQLSALVKVASYWLSLFLCTGGELVSLYKNSSVVALLPAQGDPIFHQDECSPFDIGIVYKEIAKFPDLEKFRFIQNILKPHPLFKFPLTQGSGGWFRRFKPDWLVHTHGSFIPNTWMAHSVYLVCALKWSVERMALSRISYFELR